MEIAEEASVVPLNTLGNLIFSVDLVGFDGKGMGGQMRKLSEFDGFVSCFGRLRFDWDE